VRLRRNSPALQEARPRRVGGEGAAEETAAAGKDGRAMSRSPARLVCNEFLADSKVSVRSDLDAPGTPQLKRGLRPAPKTADSLFSGDKTPTPPVKEARGVLENGSNSSNSIVAKTTPVRFRIFRLTPVGWRPLNGLTYALHASAELSLARLRDKFPCQALEIREVLP
jgi:hypothetical protein